MPERQLPKDVAEHCRRLVKTDSPAKPIAKQLLAINKEDGGYSAEDDRSPTAKAG
jgi:hypothetical protein